MSPYERPMRPPIPSTRTSSCSSMKLIAPSPTAKAVICRPFLMSWTFTHFRNAEFGCFASIATFSRTIPFACEVLLLHRILRNDFVARPVDGAFVQALVERFPEELLRLDPRLPESLRHEVHLDSPLGLRPARELDDGPLATPLSYPDCDCDDARDDRDRAAQVQEERDVVQQDDEEEAEEQREAAHREVRDRIEIEEARSARGHAPSDEPAVLQPGDVRITETHGRESATRGRCSSLHARRSPGGLRWFADEDQADARDSDQTQRNHREREGPECAREGTSEDRADDQPRPEDD